MKVLITGGTGYIGRWLCRALAGRGYRVSVLSRHPDVTMGSVEEWVTADLSDVDVLRRNLSGCEMVFHLACLPMGNSEADSSAAFQVNAMGTANLLQASLDAGVSGFIYTSTGQVYGGDQDLPNREDRLVCPGAAYAASKYCGEVWCRMFAEKHKMPVTTLRLFNVFGPAANGSRERRTVENIFIDQLLHGRKPRVTGNPLTGRDFIFIDDVIQSLLLAADSLEGYQLYNTGTGILTTLPELARLAARVVGVSIEPQIEYDDITPAQRFQADTERARNILGFTAAVALQDGLRTLLPVSSAE